MKALLIVAGLFFSIFGAAVAYYATSDPGHEYDFKLVLPIDARKMPKPFTPPTIQSWAAGETQQTQPEGRAEAGATPPIPERPPVQFNGPGAASESGQR